MSQTAREALLAEALGDLGQLLDRADAVRESITESADAAAGRVEQAGDVAAKRIENAGEAASVVIRRAVEAAAQTLSKHTAQIEGPLTKQVTRTVEAAGEMSGASRRILVLAVVLGALSGAVAAGIVGALLARLG